jgi:hypothetical protein
VTAAEILRRAAEAYRNGDIEWGRGWFRDPDTGCRCAGGALAFVATRGAESDPTCTREGEGALWVLARYLVDDLGANRIQSDPDDDVMDPVVTVAEWNDRLDRTPDQVIAALEAASERAA